MNERMKVQWPIFLQCFDTVGWVIWPQKTRTRYDL